MRRKKIKPFVISDSIFLIADAAKANARAVLQIEKKLALTERQMFLKVSKQHSDVLNLIEPHLQKYESYYDCVKRLLRKNRRSSHE
jgi:hypothetical protein